MTRRPTTPRKLGRRRFLHSTTAAMMAAPFLGSFVRSAHAATPTPRLLLFFTPNEPMNRDFWRPDGNGSEFQIQQMPAIFEALEPFRQKLTMIGRLDMKARMDDPNEAGHNGTGHMLTGRRIAQYGNDEPAFWASGPSVDQVIAKELGLETLTLGVRTTNAIGTKRIIYTGKDEPVHPIEDPAKAFDRVFEGAGGDNDDFEALRTRRLSVLDHIAKDITTLKQDLPSAHREKLDAHLERVNVLEKQIADDIALACDPGTKPSVDWNSNAATPNTIRRQADILVQAMACGAAPIGTLQIAHSAGGNLTPVWPDEGINISRHYHDLCHDFNQRPGDNQIRQRRIQVEQFFSRMFAYLLQRMDDMPDPSGGTLLDNSLVLWCKPIGKKHDPTETLWMLAGSGGGVLEPGRCLEFDGRSHNDLLASVCNLMGVETDSFGDPKYCAGPLPL